MYTCPACKKTHEETKFYCDECHEHHCSLDCLKYKDFPEYDECRAQELTDLTFSCCGRCYCTKCHSWMMYTDTDEIILWCEKCERFFHDECDCDIEHGNESCMCRLCIDLKNNEKKVICPTCHNECNVKQLSFEDLNDIEQYILFDSPEWENLDASQYYGKHVKMVCTDPNFMKHYIGFDFSECKKFEKLKEVVDFPKFNLSNYLPIKSIECDCKFCKHIKCNTLLFRLMFNDFELNDDCNAWEMGNDLTPVRVLNEFANSSDNDCNCEICKFWKAYD